MGIRLEWVDWQPGPITSLLGRLFEHVSDQPLPPNLPALPPGLRPYVDLLYRSAQYTWTNRPQPQGLHVADNGTAVVGFSAGKDSTGAALKFRAQGKEVHLVHVRGLNRSHPHEYKAAVDIANHLGMPLQVVTVRQHGSTPYRESIMKNQLILGITMDVGLRLGAGAVHYAGGNVATDNADLLVYEASYSDSQELYTALVPWLLDTVAGAQVYQDWMSCNTESFLLIDQHAPTVLPLVLSCMMPVRYKPPLRRRYQDRFGVKLMPGRCGHCWKCGQEYMHQVLLGHAEASRAMVQHALRAVRKDAAVIWQPQHQPETPEEVMRLVIEDRWLDYRPLLEHCTVYPCAPPRGRVRGGYIHGQ